MRIHNFDGFINENEHAGGGNKFILVRFGTTPDMRVTRLFNDIAVRNPKPIAFPLPPVGAIITMFTSSKTKEDVVSALDGLSISYNLYQIVHDSAGRGRVESVARELTVAELKAKLAKAIKAEKYEEASRLRDEIAQKEGRNVSTPAEPATPAASSESELFRFETFLSEKEEAEEESTSDEEFNKLVSELVDHELAEVESGEETFMKDTCEKIKAYMIEKGTYVAKENSTEE